MRFPLIRLRLHPGAHRGFQATLANHVPALRRTCVVPGGSVLAGRGAIRYDSRPARSAPAIMRVHPFGSVAQLVEQYPFKVLVLGSSPSRPTSHDLGVFAGMRFRRSAARRAASLSGYFCVTPSSVLRASV